MSALKEELFGLRSLAASVTVTQEEFEKDFDANGHIDWIAAATNLRARNCRIKEEDRIEIKRLAGKITVGSPNDPTRDDAWAIYRMGPARDVSAVHCEGQWIYAGFKQSHADRLALGIAEVVEIATGEKLPSTAKRLFITVSAGFFTDEETFEDVLLPTFVLDLV